MSGGKVVSPERWITTVPSLRGRLNTKLPPLAREGGGGAVNQICGLDKIMASSLPPGFYAPSTLGCNWLFTPSNQLQVLVVCVFRGGVSRGVDPLRSSFVRSHRALP